ncbi:flagellar type III secretion system protein FlhB [Duganella sp. BJB488]|uniref:EscU/YscU/HrcU family type III secretion system export apparatus switch protein n=1 Tax=unclassified Duganella TaxID=2636909 RepID=UPI000E351DF9|nr:MULTISPECIES: flagellar type III secretion system protein FlhB [unclassified Duganella]NVD69739.1 flagellar type III secretion system protein FlhB [Duganella sp. BJB1802]RFP10247.1 flagellar type III secretion system protein FlhB [Duganella sp. BJB489]RFP18154.1 flagellar type III secretion system protein FlhB [Duganella sp. BJB488]RFP37915.1 flagellar type III secretion system protein FlhB [Duganella sp. BJB480]
MAEQDSADKTEKASQQKLKKSRQEGQVVRSRDLSTAIGILVSLKLFVYLLPDYLAEFLEIFHQSYAPLGATGSIDNAMSTVFSSSMWLLIKMVLPLFVVPFFIVLGAMVPGGWVITTKHWEPKMERLSPAANLGRLFSAKHGTEFLISLAKAGVLIAVLIHVARSTVQNYTQLQHMPMGQAMMSGSNLMLDGLMSLIAVFIIFALIDVPAQAYFFAKNQRMSKQDQKEEHKSTEGRPEVKSRIRQLQRAMARRSARKTVPTADVVIVNPEHYAVALKYDQGRAEAPYVVAKGIDEMALYIRQLAAEFKIEVMPLAPLARAIYNTSQVNQQIPVQLYQAVSQVLNYVLQLQAFRTGRRSAEPVYPKEVDVPTSMSEASKS